ncbi:AAA family ATPase [Micromonospora fiedleri]|uniref:AAA family ATPase n=1 Tax=Micromonospora fiedleri TaxID=1157498 RepID=A0ABS1UH58_9ACTN|nr:MULTISPECIES: AAA family ATPase [Micromonospora]MBL6275670.1 AAA family ATPase [Micromonospora fiedleri]WSK41790.1 AAA family ATPase [Micromonospora maris]
MDGSETGWGRPAEPAPRWRALLDRARLGGRGAEQASTERQADEPPPPTEPLPRRTSSSGYSGRATAAGPPMDRAYGAEPGYRAEASYRLDAARPAPQTYRGQPGYQPEQPAYPQVPEPRRPEPVESRYTLLDNGYRHAAPPIDSRYALLDNGYQPPAPAPAPPLLPGPPAPPAHPGPAAPQGPPAPPAAVASATVAGRPGRIEWRAQSAENEWERAAAVLRKDLGTPRVIAFANPKGGVHKTTATVLGAATIGSVRGRGVLAWDDNELRGTLGLRAGSARHARTIRHLVSDLVQIEIREGNDLLEALDDYLRHASDGSYDVLAGEESPRFAQRLDQFTVKRVLELLRRTHDVICVDTGNNVESPNWRTVMHAADQLVVTTVPREDAAFSADWMLDLLHSEGMGELADNAVTLISCPTPGRLPLQNDLEKHFATRTRAVAVVPYDPALETGSSIEYHQLQGETRQAWMRAAAVMLEPFAR